MMHAISMLWDGVPSRGEKLRIGLDGKDGSVLERKRKKGKP